jgi:hypothetical protein
VKRTTENLEHRIQLKKDEIVRYEQCVVNYPEERMKTYGIPYLEKLKNDLHKLENQLKDRELNKELTKNLGYSRIGRNNI